MAEPGIMKSLSSIDLNQKRPSLLDVVLENSNTYKEGLILSRLVYITALSSRQARHHPHNTVVKAIVDKYRTPEVDVTGLCILYPTCAIHLLEAQSVTLWAILRDLMGPKGKEAMMAEGTARVIAFSEDIGARLFTSWGSSFVHEKNTTEQVEPLAPVAALNAVMEVNAVLRRIGKTQAALPQREVERQQETLEAYYLDLPVPNVPLALLQYEDAPTFADLLSIYDASVSADLDSEKVWPVAGLKL